MTLHDFPHMLSKVVNLALKGNPYALDAWKIIDRRIKADLGITVQDLSEVEELLEDAELDDVGIGLTMDCRREKVMA